MSNNHYITIDPGTSKVGLTAKFILNEPYFKQKQVQCTLCGAFVDIPKTFLSDVEQLAKKIGSQDANILFAIHHPASIPVTKSPSGVIEQKRKEELEEAWKNRKKS